MSLNMKQIQNALKHLERLRPAKLNTAANRIFSVREAIFLVAPKLQEMRELGFTSRELAASMTEQGVVIKAATLNRYLSEFQKETAATIGQEAYGRESATNAQTAVPMTAARFSPLSDLSLPLQPQKSALASAEGGL